jgi:hypothetical protein
VLDLETYLIELVDRWRKLKLDLRVQLENIFDKIRNLLALRRQCISRSPCHSSLSDLFQTDLEILNLTHCARFIHIVEEVSLVKL